MYQIRFLIRSFIWKKKKNKCIKFRVLIIRLYNKYDTRSNFPISGNDRLNIVYFDSWYSYPGIENRNIKSCLWREYGPYYSGHLFQLIVEYSSKKRVVKKRWCFVIFTDFLPLVILAANHLKHRYQIERKTSSEHEQWWLNEFANVFNRKVLPFDMRLKHFRTGNRIILC